MLGLAGQAAIAIDNARLFEAAQRVNQTLEQRVEERTHDLEAAHEALRQSQKMETVGQLTGGIAHDFNNLLQIVSGNLDLLRQKLPDGSEHLKRYADRAFTGADRAATFTQRLLAFSRRQPLAPKPLDINRLDSRNVGVAPPHARGNDRGRSRARPASVDGRSRS